MNALDIAIPLGSQQERDGHDRDSNVLRLEMPGGLPDPQTSANHASQTAHDIHAPAKTNAATANRSTKSNLN